MVFRFTESACSNAMQRAALCANAGKIVASKEEIRSRILRKAGYRTGRDLLRSLPWEEMEGEIAAALKVLLDGRNRLRKINDDRTFALDGRLVGDIGETIAARIFSLQLLKPGAKNVDAVTIGEPKRSVQVKATLQDDSLSLKHDGDYVIGLQINEDDRFRVIYNGPAETVMNYLRAPMARRNTGRRNAGNGLEPISLGTWATLNLEVRDQDRIPRCA